MPPAARTRTNAPPVPAPGAPNLHLVLLRCGGLPALTKQLAAGFALTMASTAATLVPPVPHHPADGRHPDPVPERQTDRPLAGADVPGRVAAVGPAGLGPLGWARTYILALVSERIGADLRTTTYEHLLRLSLDYFGGKRTGDLMARIGSETDRINVFLSLHLLDFATDVLMIA